MWLLALAACTWFSDLRKDVYDTGVPRNCEERSTFWLDEDGDGFGTASDIYIGCDQPTGYAANPDDCDDADATRTTDCDTGG